VATAPTRSQKRSNRSSPRWSAYLLLATSGCTRSSTTVQAADWIINDFSRRESLHHAQVMALLIALRLLRIVDIAPDWVTEFASSHLSSADARVRCCSLFALKSLSADEETLTKLTIEPCAANAPSVS
jgi:hypothetical protein